MRMDMQTYRLVGSQNKTYEITFLSRLLSLRFRVWCDKRMMKRRMKGIPAFCVS